MTTSSSRSMQVRLLAAAVVGSLACLAAGATSRAQAPAAAFSVVEATIPEMQAALRRGA